MKTKLKSILAVALCAVGFAAFAEPLLGTGTEDNPWKIGKPTAADVEAWTNGTGRLEINAPDGESAMMDFDTSAPWAGAVVTESIVGSNVTAIGKNAFANCSSLKTLVLYAAKPLALGEGNDFNGVTIFVPAGAADAYRAAWPTLAAQIEEMRSVKGDPLTTHLYEMTYNWWDATKANDIGEELAALMEKVFNWQEVQDDYFFPYQFFDWYKDFNDRALCTSCRNGNFVGRNFDWGYDDVDECVMHIPAAEGRLASVGVASWFFPQWMQDAFDVDSFLPELTMDGVNEMGVAINVNVVPSGDNGWTTNTNPKATKRLNAGFAVRTVLDNATNAAHAVEILQSRNIYSLKPLEFHWMISDATESYVVECVSNALVVLKAHDARPKMSNYYVSHSPSVGEYDILTNAELTATAHTPHAMGIERYANVSNGLESVESVDEMYTHMTNVWYKPKFLPGNELKYWSDLNGAPVPGKSGVRFEFGDETIAGRYQDREKAFKEIQENYVAVTNYEAQTGFRTIDRTKHEWDWLTNEVVHTVHTSIYDIEKRMLRVVVQEDASYSFDAYLTPPQQEISAVSAEGFLDLTVGDRIAEDEEPIVADPAWGNGERAYVAIDGEGSARSYTALTIDTWDTTALAPGRYGMTLTAGKIEGETAYTAGFWKTGEGWEVFDSSNITADKTFEEGKTYLVLGTNTVSDGVTLTVTDGAKFAYGEGAGFKGGTVAMPKRYETKPVGELFQIVEKIKGCEDNPWEIGDGVEAYTNGTELVIVGEGTVEDVSEVLSGAKGGIEAITIPEATVKGAEENAFNDFNNISLTLPDGWQGELPKNGVWYGATGVELTRWPMAVKNVKPQQRYPWNGLVDVTYDVSGSNTVAVTLSVMTNGIKAVANPTVTGTTTADLGDGKELKKLKLTWDAKADFGDEGLHEKIKVKLTITPAK